MPNSVQLIASSRQIHHDRTSFAKTPRRCYCIPIGSMTLDDVIVVDASLLLVTGTSSTTSTTAPRGFKGSNGFHLLFCVLFHIAQSVRLF